MLDTFKTMITCIHKRACFCILADNTLFKIKRSCFLQGSNGPMAVLFWLNEHYTSLSPIKTPPLPCLQCKNPNLTNKIPLQSVVHCCTTMKYWGRPECYYLYQPTSAKSNEGMKVTRSGCAKHTKTNTRFLRCKHNILQVDMQCTQSLRNSPNCTSFGDNYLYCYIRTRRWPCSNARQLPVIWTTVQNHEWLHYGNTKCLCLSIE